MKKIFILSFLIFLSSECLSQELKQTIDISLEITSDEIIKSQVHSLILKQLRDFDDVRIVSRDRSYYSIEVIVTEISLQNGPQTGYVSSILVNRNIQHQSLIGSLGSLEAANRGIFSGKEVDLVRQEVDTTLGDIIRAYYDGAMHNVLHIMLIDPDLESLSKRIVAEIDYEVFHSARKILPYIQN